MSHLTQKQLVAMLIETERTADKILQGKQQIVSLDKCRQATREAIRNLEKSKQDKSWITLGSNLVKLETTKALELLKKGRQLKIVHLFWLVINLFFSLFDRSTSSQCRNQQDT